MSGEFKIALSKVGLADGTMEYLKRRVGSFIKANYMGPKDWESLRAESEGIRDEIDVTVAQDLVAYHMHRIKVKKQRDFSYKDFNEFDFIKFQANQEAEEEEREATEIAFKHERQESHQAEVSTEGQAEKESRTEGPAGEELKAEGESDMDEAEEAALRSGEETLEK